MTARILIIGGYGNFGSFIAKQLAAEKDVQLIIAGRSPEKASAFASSIAAVNPVESGALDIHGDVDSVFALFRPDIVIHTSGPFQGQGYGVAEACIRARSHYIDLADGRAFVAGMAALQDRAQEAGVLVVSGASSVPALTSALVDHYTTEFRTVTALDYGITTAQRTNRGQATTAAILSYTGRPIPTLIAGRPAVVHGWQGLHRRHYPGVGFRYLGNCDVPDLAIFPDRYPGLKTIRFYAGLEVPFLHWGLWGMSWLVRAGLIRRLERAAGLLLTLSFLFDRLGTDVSALHMALSGEGEDGNRKTLTFYLTARSGDGPYIPCMPAILLARRLARGELTARGATACVGLISLADYLGSLDALDIRWHTEWT